MVLDQALKETKQRRNGIMDLVVAIGGFMPEIPLGVSNGQA
jgi:hypothetical protein